MLMYKKEDSATFQALLDLTVFLQVCSSFGVLWSKNNLSSFQKKKKEKHRFKGFLM